jgi:hypothetical protein
MNAEKADWNRNDFKPDWPGREVSNGGDSMSPSGVIGIFHAKRTAYPVDPKVGHVKHNSPDNIRELAA